MSITRNEIKNIKSYLTKKGRKKDNKFIAEGVRLLEEAFNYGNFPERILYSKSMIDDRSEQLLTNFHKKNVLITELSAHDMRSLSDTKSPQGIAAVFRMSDKNASELSNRKIRKVLWCEDISDPGNVGTLLRSALAFGYSHVIMSGSSADVYAPKVVRASMGAIFNLKIVKDTNKNILNSIEKNNFKLMAADMNGKPIPFIIRQLKKDRYVLAVGSEAFGLSQEIRAGAWQSVRIEHKQTVESLNAAVAGSILMNEFFKAEKVPNA